MAKTYNNLYGKVIDYDNIVAAINAAAKGKRRKRSVQRCLTDVDKTARIIIEKIERGDYGFPEVRPAHYINDGIQAKRRTIIHPAFHEQIIDHAFLQILSPIFMRSFDPHSYGSIPGRGQEGMIRYVMCKVRRRQDKVKYYAKLDVKKCFDTISPEAVYNEIKTHYVRDRRVLAWVRAKLAANTLKTPEGDILKVGVPIGLFTSPWFVNVILSRIDHILKDRFGVYCLVRFMDDLLILHGNKREMMKAITAAGDELEVFGMNWKAVPKATKWEYGDRGKIRFCGVQITRETCEVRDAVFIRAVRTGNRISSKMHKKLRVTWYDAAKNISYGGRFRAFESYRAFVKNVLKDGKTKFSSMRQKIAAHDKLKAKGNAK